MPSHLGFSGHLLALLLLPWLAAAQQVAVMPCPSTSTLAACVTAAPAGYTITLAPATTYVVTTNIVVSRFNVTIACPSWGTTIQRSATLTGIMLSFTGTGNVLQGCTIDGNGIANTAVANADVAITSISGGALGNNFIRARARSLALNGDKAWARQNTVVGIGPTDSTLQSYGIWAIQNKTGIIIDGNTVSDTGIDGIGVNGVGTIVSNNRVSNCHCLLNTGGGQIAFYPGPTLTVSAATWAGGQVTFTTTVSHNLTVGTMFIVAGMSPASWNGSYVIANAPAGNQLTARRVRDPGASVAMGTLSPDQGTSITSTGNTIDQGCSPNSYGIEVNARHVSLKGDTVRNQNNTGIVLDKSAAYVDIDELVSNSNQSRAETPITPNITIRGGAQHVTLAGSATGDEADPTVSHAIYIRRGADWITVNGMDLTGTNHGPVYNENASANIRIDQLSNMTDLITVVPTAGRLYAEPIWIQGDASGFITSLTANITATTGGSVRFGIYSDGGSPTTPTPLNRIYDSGIISVGAMGALSTGAISVTMPCSECLVWLVSVWKCTTPPTVTAMPVVSNPRSGIYSPNYTDATLATALPTAFGTPSIGTTAVPVITAGF